MDLKNLNPFNPAKDSRQKHEVVCHNHDGVRSKETCLQQISHNKPLETYHVHNRPVHNRPVHNRPRSKLTSS